MVLVIELYLFISLSVSFSIFQGQSSVNSCNRNFCVLSQLKLKEIVKAFKYIVNVSPFLMSTHIQGR